MKTARQIRIQIVFAIGTQEQGSQIRRREPNGGAADVVPDGLKLASTSRAAVLKDQLCNVRCPDRVRELQGRPSVPGAFDGSLCSWDVTTPSSKAPGPCRERFSVFGAGRGQIFGMPN